MLILLIFEVDFLILFYLLIWLIISLEINLEVAVAGIIVSVAAYLFTRRHLLLRPFENRNMLRSLLNMLRYALVLVYEIAKANIAMFRLVFSKNIEIDPQLIYFRTDIKSNYARVVLANSITLTPGTITVALNDDIYCVHCLNTEMAEDIEDSHFVRQLKNFETF